MVIEVFEGIDLGETELHCVDLVDLSSATENIQPWNAGFRLDAFRVGKGKTKSEADMVAWLLIANQKLNIWIWLAPLRFGITLVV